MLTKCSDILNKIMIKGILLFTSPLKYLPEMRKMPSLLFESSIILCLTCNFQIFTPFLTIQWEFLTTQSVIDFYKELASGTHANIQKVRTLEFHQKQYGKQKERLRLFLFMCPATSLISLQTKDGGLM
jgi:hypothetical protein